MSPTVVILIIIGLIFIISSFAISVKLESENDKEIDGIVIPDELEEAKKEKIRELVDNYMNEYIDDKLLDIESKLSEIVNQKTLALGDYAVSVNEEIEKNHNEVMFLYNMLQEKDKEIKNEMASIYDIKKEMQLFIEESKLQFQSNYMDIEVEKELKQAIKSIDESLFNVDTEYTTNEDTSSNDIILELHKSGLSILEIAKQLGLGVGEVKLVVDLYQGASK